MCNLVCRNLKVIFQQEKNNLNFSNIDNLHTKANNTIIKESGIVYTIYNGGLYINATKIRFKNDMEKIMAFFVKINFKILKFKINNSLFSSQLKNKNDNFSTIINKIKNAQIKTHRLCFNFESFPAIFLKPILKGAYPTILIFKNSKLILIGGKEITNILKIEKTLQKL